MCEAVKKEWRCFHCDELFVTFEDANDHFGDNMYNEPACRLNELEGGILGLYRQSMRELRAYREEDTKLIREVYALGGKHQREKQEMEEIGYSRGLHDSRLVE